MTDTYHPDNLDNNNVQYILAKADTGASNHYWRQKDKDFLKNVKMKQGPPVQLPNSEIIHTTATGVVPLSHELSKKARNTMILPKLTSSSLISLGQLCDDNCDILLNKNEMCAIKNNKIILKGYRNHKDGLWDIPIKKPPSHPTAANPPIHTHHCIPTEAPQRKIHHPLHLSVENNFLLIINALIIHLSMLRGKMNYENNMSGMRISSKN